MSTPPARPGLGGRGILVTRPAARASELCRLIGQAGGEAVLFPTLEIEAIGACLPETGPGRMQSIAADLIIFVSPTAVEQGLAVLSGRLPAGAAIAAVGDATASALRKAGCAQVLSPASGADSEALAALPQLQNLGGQRILIVRGVGGRNWLGDTLQGRGAQVVYAECYRRRRPQADIGPLLDRWRAGAIAAVTMTSREALDNLMAMARTERALICASPLFAAHRRIASHARSLGWRQVVETGAGDQAMVDSLQSFFATVA